MASVDGGPPSLLNQFVKSCWVVGARRIVGHRGEEQFIEVRTELSDQSVFHLLRTESDLGRLIKRLVDSFPEERDILSKSLLDGLMQIKEAREASATESLLGEVEKLLRNVINMPWKYSRSEAVLLFFEMSQADQALRENEFIDSDLLYRSPVTISDVMRSNGFCLANTETIVCDPKAPGDGDRCPSVDSTQQEDCGRTGLEKEVYLKTPSEESSTSNQDLTSLSYYQLLSHETDILE